MCSVLAPRELVFEERQLSYTKQDEYSILAKTLVTAISPGTETAAWLGLPPLRTGPVVYPRLVGYCNVAEVVHCGSKCSGIKPGDRILTFQSHCSHFLVNFSDVLAVVPDDLDSQSAVKAYLFHLGYSKIHLPTCRR